jgi:hypothetical protein
VIAALYVLPKGPYFELSGIDPWDESRDARLYAGPHPVIAHPPCERWGRYWGGGPMLHGTERQKILGDDKGCFAHALWAVRSFGGVLEHPEASHAFHFYGLPIPQRSGGWTEPDKFGGRSACVAQGHYGHRAQKLTWLYAKIESFPELKWGLCPGKQRLDEGFHSKEERRRIIRTGICQRLSKRQRAETPQAFRDLLISMISQRRSE